MDVLLPVLIAIFTFALGFLGVWVTLKPPDWVQVHRKPIIGTFIAVSVIGIAVTGWLAFIGHASGEDSKRTLLGDAEHPPWVAVISMPWETRFVLTNNSDYPAYIIAVELFDNTAGGRGTEVRRYPARELAAHTAMVDEVPWNPPPDGKPHHFGAQISTRTGLFNEEMILVPSGNNQWARAVRVTQGMRTLEEDIDSAWPRDDKGQVNWRNPPKQIP
jgi:hypothetical protein